METGDGKRLVLRVYNNGSNTARVRWEHAVLGALAPHRAELSFAVPTPLPALGSGASHVPLPDGAEASLFELIPGGLPKLTCVRAIGKATGQLTLAMSAIAESKQLDALPCPTAPYHDIYAVHHAASPELFASTVAGTAFDGCREATTFLCQELATIEAACASFGSLPQSLIHGDLHYDNVLVLDGQVSGLLDFEFSARDYRAMELAICLSKYVGEPEPLPFLQDFIAGFAEGGGELTPEEIAALPTLINLRVLSNVVYFVGRALAGEDDIKSLTSRAETYANRVRWVNANGATLTAQLTAALARR